ncbi:MAG: cytochrome c [Acidobacteriia bacterium]|nr:cytochrome c [Terriglobia bacterium]
MPMRPLNLLACSALLLVAVSASGQDAAKYFDGNCGMCHAIGGPPGGAPDLKDVTKRRDHRWLIRFILNPDEVAKADPDAAALVKQFDGMVMPTTDGATEPIVEALLKYIDAAGGAPAQAPAAAATMPPARTVTASDVANGRDLYEGRRRLAHRGPSCVSCHRLESIGGLGGGTLGPDLTRVDQRLGGTRGLTAWLGNPPTRVMRAVFRSQPLADDETFAIAAMLGDTSAREPAAAQSRARAFVATGVAGALMTLALMAMLWSRRLRAVRRPLVDAARRGRGDAR